MSTSKYVVEAARLVTMLLRQREQGSQHCATEPVKIHHRINHDVKEEEEENTEETEGNETDLDADAINDDNGMDNWEDNLMAIDDVDEDEESGASNEISVCRSGPCNRNKD